MMQHDASHYTTNASLFTGGALCSCVVTEKNTGQQLYGKSVVGLSEVDAYLAALKEKCALSLYAFFGIAVPQTKILRLPIMWAHEGYSNELFGLPNRTHTYYLCSNVLELQHCSNTALPDIKSIGAILAVAFWINDIDVLGGGFTNIGFINNNDSDQWVKIDAGEAFSTIDETQVDKIRYCTQGTDVYLTINELPPNVQKEFHAVLRKIASTSAHELKLFLTTIVNPKKNSPLPDGFGFVDTLMRFLAKRTTHLLNVKDNNI
ncbi:MAG TPA: hypothetical protein PLD88_14735 [Candidatus Berkiella sp.]|nr:hypothetical protein [Candidatus Berkiella sp.]